MNDNWGGAAAGGDWNAGAAVSNGFTPQDARAGGDGFGNTDVGSGGAATEGASDGNCRNCGQGEPRVTAIQCGYC